MIRSLLRSLPFLLTGFALVACDSGNKVVLNNGDTPPTFATASLSAPSVRFPDDMRGKAVVIRFWADWCRYCEGEMQAIERVLQRHKGEGLEVLAVNAGQDRQTIEAFIKKIGVTYPALIDEKSSIAKQYGVVALPTTFFIGRDGRIRAKVIGEADEATFERVALEALK